MKNMVRERNIKDRIWVKNLERKKVGNGVLFFSFTRNGVKKWSQIKRRKLNYIRIHFIC